MADVLQFPNIRIERQHGDEQPECTLPDITGVGRAHDFDKAIMVYFDRPLTDREMREFHDLLKII